MSQAPETRHKEMQFTEHQNKVIFNTYGVKLLNYT